jgi:hypothetical protein
VKWFKPILFSALIAYLFIGNIGLSIFKHYCEEDGLFTSYFINNTQHCEDEVSNSTIPDCCKKNKIESKQFQFKDDCCSDEYECFKISLDYFKGKEDLSTYGLLKNNVIISVISHTFTQIHSERIIKHVDPPPKFHGRNLLIKNQVFRI